MNKRIILDIGHPAQVHNFKNLYFELEKKGWDVLFTVRDKEVAVQLLKHHNLKYSKLFKNKGNLLFRIIIQILNILSFFLICIKYKPSFILSRNSIQATFIAKVLNIKHFAFSDTEHSLDLSRYVDVIFTAKSYRKRLGKNNIRFDGNIELFYLHPNRFNLKYDISKLLKIMPGERFVLIRFVSWNAHHDVGHKGLSLR